jgi:hypothetical protein
VIPYCKAELGNLTLLTSIPTPQSEHLVKNHYISVNSNSTASPKNMKKLPVSIYFSFIAGIVDDTGD